MSHGASIGLVQDRPCWHCGHFLALSDSGATCIRGDRAQMVARPQGGCAFHQLDPERVGMPRPQPVSFLDAWRMVPRHIERPAELLELMRAEFRAVVCTGDLDEAQAFAALHRANRKRQITVVIHAGDELAHAWGMRNLREVLHRDDPMGARPHALIALPGGGAWVGELVRWARSQGLPVWAPSRRDLARMTAAAGPAPTTMPGWRDAREHQWSRDPGRGRRHR